MALRPSGMSEEEFKKRVDYAPGSQAGAAVGQSIRKVSRLGGEVVKDAVRPVKSGILAAGGAIDRGLEAAGGFAQGVATGRPVPVVSRPAAVQPVVASPAPASVVAPAPATTPASPTGSARGRGAPPTTGGGAPTAIGGGAPTSYQTGDGRTGTLPAGVAVVRQPNGTNAFGATGASVATATQPGVPAQNGGVPVVQRPQLVAGAAGPAVASTFGLGVNDPRANDQQMVVRRPGTLTLNPAGNAESFNNRQDREAQAALVSSLDSERFRQSLISAHGGRRGRAADQNIVDIGQQQAAIANAQANQSGEAIQNRNKNNTVIQNTGLEQDGANNRALLDANNRLTIAGMGDETERFRIASDVARPQLVQDASGNYQQVSGTNAAQVMDANGKPVRGVTRPDPADGENQKLQAAMAETAAQLLDRMTPANKDTGEYSPEQYEQARISAMRLYGKSQQAPEPPPAAIADLKADPKLAAQFDETFGAGAAARYLNR